MKRLITTVICIFAIAMSLSAQDLIVKIDKSRVEAKVLEISPEQISYKKWNNIDGPTYILPVIDINYIQFTNGSKEIFNVDVTKITTPVSPIEITLVSTPQVYEGTKYNIGDIYSQDGVEGVVCMLTEDRQHGLLISLDEIYLPWSIFKRDNARLVGADDVLCGATNMETIKKYIEDNNLSWDDFPAFKWCRDKGEGWYLPAIDEIRTIGSNYNGGSRTTFNRKFRADFNKNMKNNGGDKLDRIVYYFSSTELNKDQATSSHMAIKPPYVVNISKHKKFIIRAVHKF